jgi:hypothetical protein
MYNFNYEYMTFLYVVHVYMFCNVVLYCFTRKGLGQGATSEKGTFMHKRWLKRLTWKGHFSSVNKRKLLFKWLVFIGYFASIISRFYFETFEDVVFLPPLQQKSYQNYRYDYSFIIPTWYILFERKKYAVIDFSSGCVYNHLLVHTCMYSIPSS